MKLDAHTICAPEELVSVPPPGTVHHFDHYWWNVHPEHGLVFYTRNGRDVYPQANSLEIVTRKLSEDLYPDMEIRQIPHVFLRELADGQLRLPKECY